MARPHRNRLRIDIHPTGDDGASAESRLARADAAILSLARLLGRQMAREQFERKLAREGKGRRNPAPRDDA